MLVLLYFYRGLNLFYNMDVYGGIYNLDAIQVYDNFRVLRFHAF